MNIGFEEVTEEGVAEAVAACVSHWESENEWVLATSPHLALGLSFFSEADLRGYAIVDCGATKSMSGVALFDFVRDEIYAAYGQDMTELDCKERARLTDANNTTGKSVGKGGIPHPMAF